MTRLYDTVGWLLSSLGLALLVCGWVLVPQNRLLGEEEGGEVSLGPSCILCGNACGDWPSCPGWCTGAGCARCGCYPLIFDCACLW